ncbi:MULTISPECIES: DUF262 domain-containing protein [unclassified Sphingobacterium]|uniref:DUF262 domain-containing protein n=1 Tax=unclassified Sphingobacterium TaxID=2609468 RepID=UPI0020C31A7F|nr:MULTISPECIES: DUF262 domain-containing protein [unclassified Sphingobacterium]
MEVKAEVKSISRLKDYFFIVPDYQREYVWKADNQVEQFLIDIENEYEPFSSHPSSYFIGSIIIVENKGKYDVIDGQQRLTTIMLSLCAFRDLLHTIDLDSKQKKYLKNVEELLTDFDLESDREQLRLELQYEESSGFLGKLINNEDYTDVYTSSVERMQEAYLKVKSSFSQILDEGTDNLLDYVKYFLTRVELVIIESENLSSALKIFETINQRGAGLNAMDLVKNLLFAKANEADFQKIKHIWKEIMLNLQQCREDSSPLRFLRYFVIARYHNGIIREDELYRWFISKEGVEALNYEKNPLGLAKELKAMSKRYSDLVIATELVKDGGQFPNVTSIGYVNKYRSRQHLILLLALSEQAENACIEYLAKQLESLFFYSITLNIQAKANETNFTKWAVKLRGKKTVDEIIPLVDEEFIPYLTERLAEFKNRFRTISHLHYSPLYRERYILGKLENTIRDKCNLPLQGNDYINSLQIEHIYPQTPKNEIIPNEFTDLQDYKYFTYRLGNTTLLEGMINQAVNNFNDLDSDWYEKKKSEYAKSDLISTKLLDNKYSVGVHTALNRFKSEINFEFDYWNKESIDKKQNIMLDLAFETWKINGKNINKI